MARKNTIVIRHKPVMSMRQILLMNLGFFDIQYSFRIQQTTINPIYKMLGASESELPILNMADPIMGLLIQPLISIMSGKTWSEKWRRRKPFFVIGTIDCSICLFLFPFVSALWMVALLLWLLDAPNNTAMEPYRAFIADRPPPSQTAEGFLAQSFFAGLGITLANTSMFLFEHIWDGVAGSGLPCCVFDAFMLESVYSIVTVLVSVLSTDEILSSPEELTQLRSKRDRKRFGTLKDISNTIVEMPKELHKLGLVYSFQWYTVFVYWQFVSLSIAKSAFNTTDVQSQAYREATTWTGLMDGSYNVVTFMVAFGLVPLAKKHGARWVHTTNLIHALVSFLILPHVTNKFLVFLPMISFGISQASLLGIPYIMTVRMVPSNGYSMYVDILDMMIVLPQLPKTVTFGFVYDTSLDKDPTNTITFTGILIGLAAIVMTQINEPPTIRDMDDVSAPPKVAGDFKESK